MKARHFVVALHDYYTDRLSGVAPTPAADEVEDPVQAAGTHSDTLERDKWCLEYLSVRYVPDILAAVDEDASGFIRINEANEFTSSKPKDWSFPQWLAFWAIGMFTPCKPSYY